METTVVLDAEELGLLDQIAAEEDRSRSDLIREAIRKTWLEGRKTPPKPGLLAALENIWRNLPSDVTEEEAEADIREAREEVRALRRARRASGG